MVLSVFAAGAEKRLQFSTRENEGAPDCQEENAGSVMDKFRGNKCLRWWLFAITIFICLIMQNDFA